LNNVPLKRAVHLSDETLPEGSTSDLRIRYVDIGNVQNARIADYDETTFAMAPSRARRLVHSGDVILSTVRTYLRAMALIEDAEDVIVSTGFAVLRPLEGVDSRFLWYAVQSEEFVAQVMRHSDGVSYPAIPPQKLTSLHIRVPSLTEQRAVTDFLDRRTVQIDELIARERTLRRLCEEHLASQVEGLLGGTRPQVSGAAAWPWLEKLPNNWSLMRVRDVVRSIQTGPFGSQLHNSDYVAGGIPVVNPSHIAGGRLTADADCAVDLTTWKRLSTYSLSAGDVVLARRGEMGRCAVVTPDEDGWLCGTGSMRLRVNDRVLPEWLATLIDSRGVRDWLELQAVGTTMQNLNPRIVGSMPIQVPPIEYQRRCIGKIENLRAGTENTSRTLQRAIELIAEYRSALITAAVTGQIDVQKRADFKSDILAGNPQHQARQRKSAMAASNSSSDSSPRSDPSRHF
jgi:type I restriction enzyme S subunit